MTYRHLLLFLAPMLVGAGCALNQSNAPSEGAPTSDDTIIERDIMGAAPGYYVVTDTDEKRPGILMIHEWWGLNGQIREEARKLAKEGYAVLAIDLYNGEIATDAARAGELAGAVRSDPEAALAKLRAGLDFLALQPEVQPERLASLGWCFGGGQSALIGTSGDDRLKATVIYYGAPIPDADAQKRMTQPVLGIWGADDQSIPVDQVRSFEQSLKDQGTDTEFYIYDGAGHAFANPTRGDAYRPEATADAWEKTLAFLKKNL